MFAACTASPATRSTASPTRCIATGTITWQHVRHEEAAAFAAAGDAAITGELAVCAAAVGPGNLHLINGLYDAHRSRVPVLAIAAHIPSKEIGGNYFQETHPQELFRECSAYCELISSPKQLPYALDIALRTAVEQKDVAVLVIPGDGPPPGHGQAFGGRHDSAEHAPVRPADAEIESAARVLRPVRDACDSRGVATSSSIWR